MLEAIYNLTLLFEVGYVVYGFGKMLLDYLWNLTLHLIIQFNLLEIEEINELWDFVNRN